MNAKKKNPNELSISEHVRELKHRIIISVLAFLVFFAVCFYFSDTCMNLLFAIGNNIGYQFIYISPQEILIQQLRVAGVFALMGSFPIILFQITRFLSPAFNFSHASFKLLCLEFVGIGMFFIGLLFAYKLLLPFTFSYLFKIGLQTNIIAQISVEKYISLFLTIILCLGTVFEIPLISVMLAKFGLVTSALMKKGKSFIIVVIFILAAIITPPDVVSQCIVAIPMIMLYQISIWLCKIFEKKKEKEK